MVQIVEFKTRLEKQIQKNKLFLLRTLEFATDIQITKLSFTLIFLLGCSLGCSSFTSKKTSFPHLEALKTSLDNKCLESRATLDIGSGSTKILVADVDFCLQKIIKIHFQDSKSIKVKESLTSKNNEIPSTIQNELVTQIQKWKDDIKNLKVQNLKPNDSKTKNSITQNLNIKSYKAVATEVFRRASNGETFIQQVSEATQIPIQIINQTQEAELGFLSALSTSPLTTNDLVVWDIGGGSMQMTSYNPGQKTFNIYQGQLASVSFKDNILKLKTSNKNISSPNPLGNTLSKKAILEAQNFSQKNVPQHIKDELQKKTVVGIGGVHEKSVLKQVQSMDSLTKTSYSKENLNKVLNLKAQLKDSALQSEYPETEVTNLALVLGFMEGLNISQVEVIPVNLTQGLIVQ